MPSFTVEYDPERKMIIKTFDKAGPDTWFDAMRGSVIADKALRTDLREKSDDPYGDAVCMLVIVNAAQATGVDSSLIAKRANIEEGKDTTKTLNVGETYFLLGPNTPPFVRTMLALHIITGRGVNAEVQSLEEAQQKAADFQKRNDEKRARTKNDPRNFYIS